jgi:hypothetical protein
MVFPCRLFGDQSEVTTSYLQHQANEYGYVYIAVDWTGMSEYDEVVVALMIATDMSNFGQFAAHPASCLCACVLGPPRTCASTLPVSVHATASSGKLVVLEHALRVAAIVPDRLHQGMLNALAAMRVMTTAIIKDKALTKSDGVTPILDGKLRHYYGNRYVIIVA